MVGEKDIRSYCNPWPPRFSQAMQEARLTGEVYVEDKTGLIIDALIRSVRKGTVVEVVEVGLLAPIKGKPSKRRALMADRMERIKARGGSIVEVETGHSTRKGHGPRMTVRGAEFIATSGRMRGKRGRAGRPGAEYTEHELMVMESCWTSRRYKNDDERLTAIEKRLGKRPKRSWMWNKFGSPSGRPE